MLWPMLQLGKDWEAGEIDGSKVIKHVVRFTNVHSPSSGEPDAVFLTFTDTRYNIFVSKTLIHIKYKSLKKNRLSQVFDM